MVKERTCGKLVALLPRRPLRRTWLVQFRANAWGRARYVCSSLELVLQSTYPAPEI